MKHHEVGDVPTTPNNETASGRGQAQETRERIRAAAVAEFCAHGYSGASTARIVAQAQCNIRMIYHYFGNKDGLYRAALQRVYEDLRDSEDKISFWTLPPKDGISELTRFTFDYMIENPQFHKLMLNENLSGGDTVRGLSSVYKNSRPLIAKIGEVIDRGCKSGDFTVCPKPIDLYLTILALSFIHLSNVHTLSATFGEDLTSDGFLARRRQHVVEVILRYLGAR